MPTQAKIEMNSAAPVGNKAVATGIIDLSDVKFTRVGNYRFIVKETKAAPSQLLQDKSNFFEIAFFVTNIVDDNGEPTGKFNVVLGKNFTDCSGLKAEKMLFSAGVLRDRIVINTRISGTGADAMRYFKYVIDFDVPFGGAGLADKVAITGQDNEVVWQDKKIQTTKEAVLGKRIEVYARAGQTITIGSANGIFELPQGVRYTIQHIEQEGFDKYTSYVDDSKNPISAKMVQKTIMAKVGEQESEVIKNEYKKSVMTEFRHYRDAGAANTGVVLNVIPFVALFALTLLGLYLAYRYAKMA